MRLRVYVNDTDYSDSVLVKSLEVSKDISAQMSTASVPFKIRGGSDVARYDTARYDQDRYAVDVRELYEIRIEEHGTGVRHFAGQISRVEFDRQSSEVTLLKCDCSDYTWILERTMVPSATFTGQSDRAIIQSLISTYAPQITALTANIAQIVPSIGYFEVKDKTLRQALEDLSALTGGEWRVDYSKNLIYFLPTAYPAPFGLSSSPDNTATFGIDRFTKYTRDAIRIINRCTVLGGFLPGGTEIRIVYDDPVSIQQYGLYPTTIVDRDITLASDALLRAKALVDENAYPQEGISLKTLKDGLDIGQSLNVYHKGYQISGSYIIRSIRMHQVTRTKTEYEIDLGVRPPDTLRLLQQLEARTRSGTQPAVAIPAPGSVTTDSVSSSGLSASVLVGTISGTNVTVNAANVIGTLSGTNVVVDAGTIQGVITGTDVFVDVSTFQGAIVSSQVADNLIDRLSLLSDPLRWIPNLSADPTLPDANYPDGAFYRRTGDNQFRKNSGGVWINVTEADAVTGKMSFHSIGTIRAGSIIGLIAAGQIDNITASQITGLISATNIGSVNMSALVGTLTAANAGRIDIGVVQGNLDVSRVQNLGTIAISTFSGNLDASRVVNLGTISINTFSGTLNASKINTLNAGSITVSGGWTSGQITSVAAGSIQAGTISASVTLTSPTLVISSGTVTVNIDASNKIKVTDSSTVVTAVMDSLGFTVSSAIGTNGYLGPNGWDLRSGGTSRLAASAVNWKATASPITLNPAIFAIFYIDGVPYKFPGYL